MRFLDQRISAFLFLILLASHLWAGNDRLAIIAPPELAPLATLLTAALSSDPQLSLVERAEIDKVLAEQKLQINGFSTKDSIRLGQILRADGLVLLEKTDQTMTTRLVDTKRGIVLESRAYPWPITDPETWSKLRATGLGRAAAKLGVNRADAIPLSLLRINCALAGSRNSATEENLNFLLAARLAADPKILLLERNQLEELAKENGEGRTWLKSSGIVEGSFMPEETGYSLDLSLQAPDGTEAKPVKVRAPNLEELIENAHAAILTALKQSVQPWNAHKESERFAEEAQWAANNGLWEQAARAMEAAVALGETSPEVLRWRWKCYDRLSRHARGARAAGGFLNDGNHRPVISQLMQMARSVQLCREALRGPPATAGAQLKISHYPETLRGGESYGTGAAAEATQLLHSAAQLIEAGEKNRPAEGPEAEALADLRREMHDLYAAIVTTFPEQALKPRPGDQIPAWSASAKSAWRSTSGDHTLNVQFERVLNGRLWENDPAAYAAFLRKCLTSDLAITPHFFFITLDLLAGKTQRESFGAPAKLGEEWRKTGKILAADSDLSAKIGGAVILGHSGKALEGIAIFGQSQAALISGKLSLEYLFECFPADPGVVLVMREVTHESPTDATGAVKDILIGLLKQGYIPSLNVLDILQYYPFSDLQAMALREALMSVHAPHSEENWSAAVAALDLTLAKRAGQPGQPTPTPRTNPPPSPSSAPIARKTAPKPTLKINQAFVVENVDEPDAPGVIRWAEAAGNKVFLQLEYAGLPSSPARREFRMLELPSLETRTLYRDRPPDFSSRGSSASGPLFATDGAGVYFWNGRNLSYATEGGCAEIESPELENPLLWLVAGKLYAADSAGVILRYDPATKHPEILASARRRPAQTLLDSESNLPRVRCIFLRQDSAAAVSLVNGKTYEYVENSHDWRLVERPLRPTPGQLQDFDPARAERMPLDGRLATDFLRSHALAQAAEPQDPRAKNQQAMQVQMNPAAQYMGEEPGGSKFPALVTSTHAIIDRGIFWGVLNKVPDQLWLLKLDVAKNQAACQPLELSRKFLGASAHARRPAPASPGDPRLLLSPAGLCLYSPNDPVLWFLPSADFPQITPP